MTILRPRPHVSMDATRMEERRIDTLTAAFLWGLVGLAAWAAVGFIIYREVMP